MVPGLSEGEAEALIAIDTNILIYAFDVDGALQWKVSFGGMAKAGLGPGTSPILYEGLLILQADLEMGAGSSIVALDAATGQLNLMFGLLCVAALGLDALLALGGGR